jgi:hypothetical protein
MSLLDDVAKDVEEALRTIEDLEILKSKVYILTRTWKERKGRGKPTDVITKVDPNPYIADFSHSSRIREGGAVKQGDLFIKYLPKKLLDQESLINLKTDNELIEKFYVIDDELYEIISIVKGFAYWNIQLRKTNKKKL